MARLPKSENIVKAIRDDQDEFRDKPFVLLRSNIFELLAETALCGTSIPGIKELPGSGGLIKEFWKILADNNLIKAQPVVSLSRETLEIGSPTFGVIDLTKAAATHAGRGYADIDTIETYLNGAVGLTWSIIGYMTSGGNLAVAERFESYGQALAQTGRFLAKESGIDKGFLRMWDKDFRNQAEVMSDMYRFAVDRCLLAGTAIPTPVEFFGGKGFDNSDRANQIFDNSGFSEQQKRKLQSYYANAKARLSDRSINVINTSPEVRSVQEALQDTHRAVELTRPGSKVIIFGSGPLAEKAYREISERLGVDNVKHVTVAPSSYERNYIAREFGADTVVRISQERYRETTEAGIRRVEKLPLSTESTAEKESNVPDGDKDSHAAMALPDTSFDGQSRGGSFWNDITYLCENFGTNPDKWPDGIQKQHVDTYIRLNYQKRLVECEFYLNILGYGVSQSPKKAALDLSKGKRDAWLNPYDAILASSPDGNKLLDVLRAPFNNVGVPVHNSKLNGKLIIALKADIHSGFVDCFRNQNGREFRILARTLDIMGAPGSSYGVNDFTRAIAVSRCEQANVFSGESDILTYLPSSVNVGSIGSAVGLIARFQLNIGRSTPSSSISVYRLPTGHTLDKKGKTLGYFDEIPNYVPNPLIRPSMENVKRTAAYVVFPGDSDKLSKNVNENDLGEWAFVNDHEFPGWLLGSKVVGAKIVTVPVFSWSLSQSAKIAANNIRSRNDKEYPDEMANIVIWGDPNSERNQQLVQELKNQGYNLADIFFVMDGNLFASDGTLLKTNYVSKNKNPFMQIAEAADRLATMRGKYCYGVVAEEAVEDIPSDNIENHNEDADGHNDNGHPSVGTVADKGRKQPFSSSPSVPAGVAHPVIAASKSSEIGGVLLNDVASVEGEIGAGSALGKGGFSILVDGRDSVMDETAYKRFVTALWAVYFGREDPGISIDPIARGAEKQLVRYIGNVRNLDLGRVMREADYQMKKWAVGTEQPEVETFKTPDDYANESGTLYLGSMSRFWFVPADMKFKVTPDAFLFDSGKMTVQTEFLMSNAEGRNADPANERFAKWFTDNYHSEIIKRYPIYQQLYDYAKLVALAKYLKESGVPLYWFLMANKDMILTEDALGTVDTLFKDSKHFQDVKIEGGVNIVQKDIKAKGYIFDEATKAAIRLAYQQYGAGKGLISKTPDGPKYVAQPVSFELGTNKCYTAIPQHSSSSGKDRHCILYQTDISLRTEGFEITPKVLTALQPAIRQRHLWNDFRGKMDDVMKAKSNAVFYAAFENALLMAQTKTGEALRKLALLQGRFYPSEPEFARDAEFALDDKDQFELLGDILVSYSKYYTSLDLVRVFDPKRANEAGDFGDGWRLLLPYRICPASATLAKGYRLPAKMEVVNLINDRRELLDFGSDNNENIGYFPSDKENSEFVGLFVLTDATFRLVDKVGAEFQFNQKMNITELIYTEDYAIGIEYLEKTSAFEDAPYRLMPDNPDDRVTFLNVALPKRMKITDTFGAVQAMEFKEEQTPIGWYPLKEKTGGLKALALMTDASYVLADGKGNEFSFNGAGSFTEALIGQDEPIVRSLKMGKNRISFKYCLDPFGNIVIAKAWVSQDEIGAKTLYVIDYQYDSTGRLANRNLLFANGKSVFGQ